MVTQWVSKLRGNMAFMSEIFVIGRALENGQITAAQASAAIANLTSANDFDNNLEDYEVVG